MANPALTAVMASANLVAASGPPVFAMTLQVSLAGNSMNSR